MDCQTGALAEKWLLFPGQGEQGMVPECKHCAVRDSGGSFLHLHERYCNTLRSGFVEKMSLSFVTFASQMAGVKVWKGDAVENEAFAFDAFRCPERKGTGIRVSSVFLQMCSSLGASGADRERLPGSRSRWQYCKFFFAPACLRFFQCRQLQVGAKDQICF